MLILIKYIVFKNTRTEKMSGFMQIKSEVVSNIPLVMVKTSVQNHIHQEGIQNVLNVKYLIDNKCNWKWK